MKLLEKILLTTDFSKSSDNVVANAIVVAKTFHSKIDLVHVLHDDVRNEKTRNFLKEAAVSELKEIRDEISSKGVEVGKQILKYGNYTDKIVGLADELGSNIIMVGSGEKVTNNLSQLGKTATNIIRKSEKPVFVVKEGKALNVANILCPVDFSIESERALKNAITIARKFKAKLVILNVYKIDYLDVSDSKKGWDKENDEKYLEHTEKFDLFLERFNLIDLSWSKEIQGGDLAIEIRKEIRKHKSDLLIMGTSGKSIFTRMIKGSVTEEVIKEIPCSFITQKSKEIINLKLEARIRDIEKHYNIANQLMKDGFFDESINEFEYCLNINEMHVPSLKGLASVYEKLGNIESSKKYTKIAQEVLVRVWDQKIEAELRNKHFSK